MQKYYDLKKINSRHAQYNVVFGERSNGKTYAVLKYALQRYADKGKQLAIVRRWQEDFTGKRGSVMFDALIANKEVFNATQGEWTSVYYYGGRWYLARFDDRGNMEHDERPFAYGFALSQGEHDKSTAYPDIDTVLFDEFISRQGYLKDEFVLFMNVLSTIIRQRDDVTIYMLGNTVNKYCPYFGEMGLTHVKSQKQGTIDVYRYGDSELKVAVEYVSPSNQGKPSDVYFAFDNPKLSMITGGEWEISVYPHCPMSYRPADVVFVYFIEFDGELLQCEVVVKDGARFLFIHRKTTPLQNEDKDLIFSPEFDPRPNHRTDITNAYDKIGKAVSVDWVADKVYYQDNEVGEIVRNYLEWCGKAK